MKNLLKISLLAVMIGIFASGCSGCGEKLSGSKTPGDTTHKVIDTASNAAIDTVKKDTTKIK